MYSIVRQIKLIFKNELLLDKDERCSLSAGYLSLVVHSTARQSSRILLLRFPNTSLTRELIKFIQIHLYQEY